MTPSVVSVQRLAFFSLRIPDSELGCDVGSARDPIKRGSCPPTFCHLLLELDAQSR